MQAYEVISPASAKKQMENFKDSNKQFYEQLSKGQVSNEDFERYKTRTPTILPICTRGPSLPPQNPAATASITPIILVSNVLMPIY